MDLQIAIVEAAAVNPSRFAAWSSQAYSSPIEAAGALVGHMFVHGGIAPLLFGFMHLFFNLMLILQAGEITAWRLGRDAAGGARFLLLFLISGVAGAVCFIVINAGEDRSAVGASGAACGLFAAYLLAARSDWRRALADPAVRSAGFWFLFVNVGLAFAITAGGVLPIAWEAHLGGFIGGAIAYTLLAPRGRAGPWG
jgi:rhomboid protease GluP